jgi:hypothetical protein
MLWIENKTFKIEDTGSEMHKYYGNDYVLLECEWQ